MEKVIITAAICGAEVTKEQNPAVPYRISEIVREAKEAAEAGASIIHLHVREDDGTPTQDRERYRACIKEIIAVCPDIIILPSTGGAVGMSTAERLQPLSLFGEFKELLPIATLDCGTLNFGNEVFATTIPMLKTFAEEMQNFHIKPELEVFEKGHIDTALMLAEQGYIQKDKMHFNMILGVKGAMNATERNLKFLVESIPKDATWTVTGVGKGHFPMAQLAIQMGGHVRVGLEDSIFLEAGVLAKGNGQLVEKAVKLARAYGREIASCEEAAKILHINTQNSKKEL